MNKQEIYETIKMLAKSQGFYGRVLEGINNNKEILTFLEKQNFKDSSDLIFFIEE